MKRLPPLAPSVVLVALVIAAWELVVRLNDVPSYLMPAPSAVAARFGTMWRTILGEATSTVAEALAGLVVGAGLALLVGTAMARWAWLERALLPLAVLLKVTPIMVIAPLLVLWFGFGPEPRVLIAALLTFFPVLVGAVTGLRATPRAALDVLDTLGASGWQETWHLRLPAALPYLFAALKVSSTLALLGAVIAEWVGSDRGLGRMVLLANANLDTTTAMAGVVTIAAIGLVMVGLCTLIERRVLVWHTGKEIA